MNKYKQGDIVIVGYPYTNKKIEKQRPALIISNQLLRGNFYDEFLLVPISTKNQEDGFDLEVKEADVTVALPKTSYIRYFKVQPVEQQDIVKKISEASPRFLKQVIEKLNEVIKLE